MERKERGVSTHYRFFSASEAIGRANWGEGTSATRSSTSLSPAIRQHVVAIRAAGGEGNGMAVEILQRLNVMSGQRVIGEKNPARVHHPRDAGHGQSLLEAVVVNEDIGSDHQVERLSWRQFHAL